MKKIVIIAAIKEEMKAIKNFMTDIVEKYIYELVIYEGKINGKECVLTQGGVGKVHAARTSQILIDNYEVLCVINVGSAGGINKELNILDIVVAKDLVQYDFDVTACGHEKGYISGLGVRINCSDELIKKCKNIIEGNSEKNYKMVVGTIATADRFCTSVEMAKEVRETFNAECVEMEGAAIGQVCMLDKIPFIVIRTISDTPDGNNSRVFKENIDFASERCANILKKLIDKI